MIKELSIFGFRGFGLPQTVAFALPDGRTPGSGLTIITGANNSGKTTIVEAISAFNYTGEQTPSFSEGRRNVETAGKVTLKLKDEGGKLYTITSIADGGSSTEKNEPFTLKYYILQSRRSIPFEFGNNYWDKDTYIASSQKLESHRSSSLDNFDVRIRQIEKQKDKFDKVLTTVLGSDFQWVVEQRDSGNYYIKYSQGDVTHSSEGIGDGIWSVFTICASLFDSEENSTVIIDEPELSVHPALQKRLMDLFLEYSMTRQIIISTHSPYFVNWEAIIDGAQLIHVAKNGTHSECYNISEDCRSRFKGIPQDTNNPHTLGIEANEALFLGDSIILVEGQEDVVIFNKISKELSIKLKGDFFGWGVGGAPKMRAFLTLFKDLGYKHIVGILDGDKAEEAQELSDEFSAQSYKIITLKENDIRDKKERRIKEKSGITTEDGKIKEEYIEYISELFDEINAAL